jgi:molybdopterin molybdotransferase
MVTPAEALNIISEKVAPLGIESIPLANANGRVAAAPFLSKRDVPIKDSSAMDGYAVNSDDTKAPGARLKVLGVIPAGADISGLKVNRGGCYKIMTGAFIPNGADAVVQKEHTDCGQDIVEIKNAVSKNTNLRFAKENLSEGELLNFVGERLTPFAISYLTSAGALYIDVYRPPRVAVISTGTEIASPSEYDDLSKMLDSNSPAIMAIVEEAGGVPSYLGVIRDDQKKLADTLSALSGYDLAVVTGGISVGDFDFMATMQDKINLRWHFDKVKQKPGKPFSFGELNGFPIMALPGNPVSSIFCAYFYVTCATLKLQGAARCFPETEAVVLGEKIINKKGFVCYNRANLVNENGILTAYSYKTQSSGIFAPLISCNAFLEIPAEAEEIEKGTILKAYRYK